VTYRCSALDPSSPDAFLLVVLDQLGLLAVFDLLGLVRIVLNLVATDQHGSCFKLVTYRYPESLGGDPTSLGVLLLLVLDLLGFFAVPGLLDLQIAATRARMAHFTIHSKISTEFFAEAWILA